jgi:hypothetical protein
MDPKSWAKRIRPNELDSMKKTSPEALRVSLLISFLLRPAAKGFHCAGLSCVIAPNSAPSPVLRKPFSLALATK